jgi:hypothetical protein
MKNLMKSLKNSSWKQHLEKSTKKCCTGSLKPDKVELWLESECNPAYVPNLDKVTKNTSKSTSKWSPKRAKTLPGADKTTLENTTRNKKSNATNLGTPSL